MLRVSIKNLAVVTGLKGVCVSHTHTLLKLCHFVYHRYSHLLIFKRKQVFIVKRLNNCNYKRSSRSISTKRPKIFTTGFRNRDLWRLPAHSSFTDKETNIKGCTQDHGVRWKRRSRCTSGLKLQVFFTPSPPCAVGPCQETEIGLPLHVALPRLTTTSTTH